MSDVIICRGGRTGHKLHLAYTGSSVLHCGHWLKTSAVHFKVDVYNATTLEQRINSRALLCEKCFPDPARSLAFMKEEENAARLLR